MEHLLALVKVIPVSFAALMPVINPIGTAVILLSLTEGADEATRRKIARTVAANTVILLVVLLVAGSYVLSFFGISVSIVQATGGLVLAKMGWDLLNQQPAATETAAVERTDPKVYLTRTFYPYTFPITVGPGCVAVALTLSAHTTHAKLVATTVDKGGAVLGIIGISVVVYFSIAYASLLARRLGPTGLSVVMRLIAFIVVCIGAQISWTGVQALLAGAGIH